MRQRWPLRALCLVAITALLGAISALPAVAEESVKQILQDESAWVNVDWFDDTTGDFQGDGTSEPYDWSNSIQTWMWDETNADGLATIIVEWAGYEDINAFGWYDANAMANNGDTIFDYGDLNATTPEYGTGAYYDGTNWTSSVSDPDFGVIFLGQDDAGTSKQLGNGDMGDASQFGLWVDSVGNSAGRWYSEHAYNSDNEVHQRVYKTTAQELGGGGITNDSYDSVWGLFWEDLADKDSSKWKWTDAHPTEPDYNDLVVEMDMDGASGAPPTPELPASVLVLLGAVPLGLGYLRHRRRTDE